MNKRTLDKVEWDYADDVISTDGQLRGRIEASHTSTGRTYLIINRHDTKTLVALRPEQVEHDPNPPDERHLPYRVGQRVLCGVRAGTVKGIRSNLFDEREQKELRVVFDDGVAEVLAPWAVIPLHDSGE